MPRRRYSSGRSSRYAPRRRSYARTRRRSTSRRRTSGRVARVQIQIVGAPGGVLAAPQSLGSKTLRPLRARF